MTRPDRHPSDTALDRWLDTGRPARVDRHVTGCEHCARIVEERSHLDGEVRAGLAAATAPPGDLGVRTDDAVRERIAADEAVSGLLELFWLPVDALAALWGAEPPARDASPPDPAPNGEDGAPDDVRSNDGERGHG